MFNIQKQHEFNLRKKSHKVAKLLALTGFAHYAYIGKPITAVFNFLCLLVVFAISIPTGVLLWVLLVLAEVGINSKARVNQYNNKLFKEISRK